MNTVFLLGLILTMSIVASSRSAQDAVDRSSTKTSQKVDIAKGNPVAKRQATYTYHQPGAGGRGRARAIARARDMWTQRGLIPELLDKAPPSVLNIAYPRKNTLTMNTGKTNTPTQVRFQPLSMFWSDMKADRYYTIIMIDPDMPSRWTPIGQKTQVLHWLMVNIPAVLPLAGRQLAPYIGSGPPPSTGIHRYAFLVFDEGTCPKNYTSVKPMDLVQIQKRVNWNFVEPGKPWTLRGFMSWAQMGPPIAGNFYQAEWDTWVDQLWRTFDQFYE